MATLDLRPISGSGTGWSNISNAYDNSTNTGATVSTTSSNYGSRKCTFALDTSVIPAGSTINNAILKASAKSNDAALILYVDIAEGNYTEREIADTLSTFNKTYTSNITNHMDKITDIIVTAYNRYAESYILTLYDLWIEVDYTAPDQPDQPEQPNIDIDIYVQNNDVNKIYLGNKKVTKLFLGNALVFDDSQE